MSEWVHQLGGAPVTLKLKRTQSFNEEK